jgi:LDH2 family malate/lactate/ureidoglycolate dehydrogenase
MEDEDFYGYLEEYAWQPFEGHRGENIALFIENLSVAMENIAREARKKTLDEVKDKLNIK